MIVSVHQPQYLPWLGYFDKIKKSDCFVILDTVQYKHREFQNRNKIRTKDGWMWLTVPVVTKGLRRQAITEVRIDNSDDWQKGHRRSLQSCYGAAPFFDEYAQFLEDVYGARRWETLAAFNLAVIRLLLAELGIGTPLCLESALGTTETATKRIIQICGKLGADTYLSGAGGREYLDEKLFAAQGIRLVYQGFSHPVYQQCFMKQEADFIPQLSVIDLIFNHGRKAREILWGGTR